MKKPKILLIGFIILWIAGFLAIWGISLFKKSSVKKTGVPFAGVKKGGGKIGGVSESEGLGPAGEIKSEAIPVRCYKVGLSDFKDELPVLGTIRGAQEIELKFEVNGVIDSINFREGDVIYKGDLIASLSKKDAQLKVDYSKSKLQSAETQALAAKKKLDIHRHLYEIGAIIKAKLEEVELEAKSARLQVESARVELKSAEEEFKKTNLYAPRDGVLGPREVEVGEFVTSHDKIATLYDTREVFLELGIVEKDIDKIALGQDITALVDAYPGVKFTGKVDYIFPVIEGKSRTLTIRSRIQNPDALLLPGMFARATITIAEFKNAIVVPSMSLNKTDEEYKVFVVGPDNKVSSRLTQVAYVTTDYTVIASGLYEDELVVTDTPQELKDGMPVKIIEVQKSAFAQ